MCLSGLVFFLFESILWIHPHTGLLQILVFLSIFSAVSLLLGRHLEKELTGVKTHSCVVLSCENTFMPLNSPLASLLLITFPRQATSFSLCFVSAWSSDVTNSFKPSWQPPLSKRASFDSMIVEI